MKKQILVAPEFSEIPQIAYCEPSGKIRGGFGIRFEDKYAFSSQFVDLNEKTLKLFIRFEGKEKKCWDCGGNRELVLTFDLDGELLDYRDLCDLPMGVH